MRGDVLEARLNHTELVVVHMPGSPTTSVMATFARGFGQDPAHAPGTAHLYEHLYLRTLRGLMTEPVVAQAETHAYRMRVAATVLAGSDRALVACLDEAVRTLAVGAVDTTARLQECRAIDVELTEWFGNPLLTAGHKLAALATGLSELARFDECGIGDSARIAAGDLRAHAVQPDVTAPQRLVIVGPRPGDEWLTLLAATTAPPVAQVGGTAGTAARWAEPLTTTIDGSRAARPGAAAAVDWAFQGSRVYVAIPIWLRGTDGAGAADSAADVLLHELGPLGEVGRCAGARFRGGSIIPAAGVVVVAASWTVENARQREELAVAMTQHSGEARPRLLTEPVTRWSATRNTASTSTTALAATVDAWHSGFGPDPCAVGPPGAESVNAVLRRGWASATLIGAGLVRVGPC